MTARFVNSVTADASITYIALSNGFNVWTSLEIDATGVLTTPGISQGNVTSFVMTAGAVLNATGYANGSPDAGPIGLLLNGNDTIDGATINSQGGTKPRLV